MCRDGHEGVREDMNLEFSRWEVLACKTATGYTICE
jgi:hypothetical protein